MTIALELLLRCAAPHVSLAAAHPNGPLKNVCVTLCGTEAGLV
jgi:hypothetical protein